MDAEVGNVEFAVGTRCTFRGNPLVRNVLRVLSIAFIAARETSAELERVRFRQD